MKTQTAKFTIHRSADRGHASHGWLESKHSFSFGNYYDPDRMGFRSLRVINQDNVAPGQGFPRHPHRDMEIFSYVLEGTLAHKDSMGNGRELQPGQIQLMSAGSGVSHSEFNPSPSETLHFLQIWITPQEKDLQPAYTEWHPSDATQSDSKVLVISPDGRDGSATIRQDADVYRILLKKGESFTHKLRQGRGLWLQLIEGSLTNNEISINSGDAISTEEAGETTFTATQDAEALLFDLA